MWSRIFSISAVMYGFRFGLNFVKRLWWVTKQLWHEITGTLFLVLALGWFPRVIKLWAAGNTPGRAVVASGIAGMMLYFGVTQFIRARDIHRKEEPQ